MEARHKRFPTLLEQVQAHALKPGYDVVIGADITYGTSIHQTLRNSLCAVAAPHAWVKCPSSVFMRFKIRVPARS